MPTKIRLARHGKKGQPFYHIVVADSRYSRDGRFIEKIGTYNPRTNPVAVDIKFDKAVSWIQKGAHITSTTRTLLSSKGVLYKAHLLKGITKGVLTQDQVETKFSKWLTEKEASIGNKKSSLQASLQDARKKRNAAEVVSRENRSSKKKAAKETAPSTDQPADGAAEPNA